jgi:dTDP-glucose 4,6-dehydratase
LKGTQLRLLVTGGAGFIGSNFIRKAIGENWPGISHITVVDKLTYAGNKENLRGVNPSDYEFIVADINDSSIFKKQISKTDAIINFAAESHVDRSIKNPRSFLESNVLGVQNLLQISLEGGLQTFIQVSTDEVYGSITSGSWTEAEPLLPNSPYAASKASADLICRSFFRTYGLDVRITRCSNNYGPFQNPEKLIPLIITNLATNKKIPIYGDGKNVRDWLHVDDHCKAIYNVLKFGSAGEIYNIGGGKELTNLEIARIILEKMGKNSDSINFVENRLGHDQRYSVDASKIRMTLGFSPNTEFQTGIDSTLDWYLRNENWWRPLIQV